MKREGMGEGRIREKIKSKLMKDEGTSKTASSNRRSCFYYFQKFKK
jgi:hypothetical protein